VVGRGADAQQCQALARVLHNPNCFCVISKTDNLDLRMPAKVRMTNKNESSAVISISIPSTGNKCTLNGLWQVPKFKGLGSLNFS
jgi:hypothetical protein